MKFLNEKNYKTLNKKIYNYLKILLNNKMIFKY